MMHELKKIFEVYETSRKAQLKAVLATVVALEGSSYRKPGVRMLILENGKMEGAVSGGCVEKEIARQAETVFSSGNPKVITYDGRYRLGCEGILYILIEPFAPSAALIAAFAENLKQRDEISITSYFAMDHQENRGFGSLIRISGEEYAFTPDRSSVRALDQFTQDLAPSLRLYIIGSEHDAVTLSGFAAAMGMEVHVVVNPKDEKTQDHFPGASVFLPVVPETFSLSGIDEQSAIVLMNHSFSKDLQFLTKVYKGQQFYTGVLGPYKRREQLLNELLEHCPDTEPGFLDTLHGPAGIDLGAETPQEIAISILAEILSVHRGRNPVKLKDKKGSIHSPSA